MRHAAELPRQPPLVVPAVAALLAALLLAAPAQAQPPRRLSAQQAERLAAAQPQVKAERGEHRGTYLKAFLKDADRWQVAVYRPARPKPVEIAQVLIDDRTGRVLEVWTGHQVDWLMARGYPGAFGRDVNAPHIWLTLSALFALPFLRRPWRLVHLDALVILGFGVSLALFNAAEIGWSVPLAYPLLGYLLVRLLALARRPERERPWTPLLGGDWLLFGCVFLLGFRIALNIVSSNVIDVGFSGVIGADLLTRGEDLYGNFPAANARGDTYGPLAYLAYVPFEMAFPWSGSWDSLPAAHAAAIAFDVGVVALLWRRVGTLAAYLWLACPWTLFALSCNSNDTLVGLLVLAAVLWRSGALTAAAGMVKFAPLALAPLLVRGWRSAAAFVAVVGAGLLLVGDLGTFYERTLGFQADRDSPFSIWGLWGLDGVQLAVGALALGLAVGMRWLAREPAAGAAAVLIAAQIAVDHWFYLYLVWFLPLVFVLHSRAAAPLRSA